MQIKRMLSLLLIVLCSTELYSPPSVYSMNQSKQNLVDSGSKDEIREDITFRMSRNTFLFNEVFYDCREDRRLIF